MVKAILCLLGVFVILFVVVMFLTALHSKIVNHIKERRLEPGARKKAIESFFILCCLMTVTSLAATAVVLFM